MNAHARLAHSTEICQSLRDMKERGKKEGNEETNNWVDVKAPKKEMAMDAAIMPASQLGSS